MTCMDTEIPKVTVAQVALQSQRLEHMTAMVRCPLTTYRPDNVQRGQNVLLFKVHVMWLRVALLELQPNHAFRCVA